MSCTEGTVRAPREMNPSPESFCEMVRLKMQNHTLCKDVEEGLTCEEEYIHGCNHHAEICKRTFATCRQDT